MGVLCLVGGKHGRSPEGSGDSVHIEVQDLTADTDCPHNLKTRPGNREIESKGIKSIKSDIKEPYTSISDMSSNRPLINVSGVHKAYNEEPKIDTESNFLFRPIVDFVEGQDVPVNVCLNI